MQHEIDNEHRLTAHELDLPRRLLLGPGPSNPDPRVLSAIRANAIGHLHPALIDLMSESQELLRHVFQPDNQLTLLVSGIGRAAMEASVTNTAEAEDVILIAINGYFGRRSAEMANRYVADPQILEGLKAKEVSSQLLNEYNIEITGGFEPLAG